MTDLMLEFYAKQESKLTIAIGQLGSFDALLDYAISALKGKTACPPEQVADYLKNRSRELKLEQDTIIFGRKD